MTLYKINVVPVSATPIAIGAFNNLFAKFKPQFCHLASGDVHSGL